MAASNHNQGAWFVALDKGAWQTDYSSSSSSSSSSVSSSSRSSSSSSSSSSSFSASMGNVVWGHDTGIDNNKIPNIRDFDLLWGGTGTTTLTGDDEKMTMQSTEYMVSETWRLSESTVEALINYDVFKTGSGPVPKIQYKTGATKAACEAVGSFSDYNGISFTCLGWVIIRIANE